MKYSKPISFFFAAIRFSVLNIRDNVAFAGIFTSVAI